MDSLLYVHTLGQGPRVLLAFHGIAQTGDTCFESFALSLGDQFTIYAFDLPFHGRSPANTLWDQSGQATAFSADTPLSKGAWKQYLAAFLARKKIETFDLVGFSMGGRFALATLEAFADRVGTVYLIAADGVVEHPFYPLATRNPLARWLYRQLLDHPAPIVALGRLASVLGILPKGVVRFARFMLATPQRRQVIFRSWVSLRDLTFDVPALHRSAKQHGVDLWLFLGQYDPMLTAQEVASFIALLPAERVLTLPSGHGRMVEKTAAYLSEVFRK